MEAVPCAVLAFRSHRHCVARWIAVVSADPVAAVRLLGPLEIEGPDGPRTLGGRKPRALLTMLLIEAGRVVSTDRLIDVVWGDDPPGSAEASLQTYVSRLRRSLDGVMTIVMRAHGYAAEVDPRVLDVALAETAIGEARRLAARGDRGAAAEVLGGAVALWRGRPLAEFADEDWARPEAYRLTELRLAAWEDLADAMLAIGEHRHLVGQLETLVEEAPLHEGLLARLVVALGRSGRQVDALAALRRHRDHLREELGLDPGPALVQLEVGLLAQQPDVVSAPGTVPPAPPSAPGLRAAPWSTPDDLLAGRSAERDALTGLVDQMLTGTGGIVVLSGEPGIGKTALASWTAATATAAGVRVVEVSAVGDEQAPPLWPWLPVVRELLTAVPAEVLPASDLEVLEALATSRGTRLDPYAVRLALASLLTAVADISPVLVVVDDLQALDAASLGAVQFLARETRQAAIAMVVTVRSSLEVTCRVLTACLDELARQPSVRWLELDGLGLDAVGAVAARAAGRPLAAQVVQSLVVRTAGNPFLVREFTHQLALAGRLDDPDAVVDPTLIPPTVIDAIGRRIDRLPEDVAEVLRLAAVAGGPADVWLLARAVDRPVDEVLDALERACAAGLLIADGGPGELRFSHALVADAALAALGPVGRARRHLALHDALSGRSDRHSVHARARHAVGALPLVDTTGALAATILAGEQAVADGDPEQATRWWSRSLEVLDRSPDPPPDARWRLTDALARARLTAGDLRSGLQTVLDACSEAERLGDRHRLALSATAPVDFALWPWRGYGEVDHRMVRALERAVATLDPAEVDVAVRAHGGLAVERYYLADPGPADEAAAEAVALARHHGDPALLALALNLAFVATWRSDRMDALEVLADELVSVAERGDLDDRTRFVGLFLRTVVRLTLGRVEQAIADEPSLYAFADRLRSPSLLVALDGYRAMRSTMQGDHAEAEGWIESGLELYRRTQVWEPRDASLLLLAPIAVERGGADALAAPLLAGRGGSTSPLARRLGCIVLAEAGFDDIVRDDISRGGPLPEPARDWSWLANACGLASVAVACGDRRLAARWATELAPHAGQLAMFGSDGCLGAVDEYRARCLALLDDPAAAMAFDAAVELHRRLGAPHLEARTLLHRARWCRVHDEGAAEQSLDAARRLAARAPALLARIEAAG